MLTVKNFPIGTRVKLKKDLGRNRFEGMEGEVHEHSFDNERNVGVVWVRWKTLPLSDPFYEPLEDQKEPQSGLYLLEII